MLGLDNQHKTNVAAAGRRDHLRHIGHLWQRGKLIQKKVYTGREMILLGLLVCIVDQKLIDSGESDPNPLMSAEDGIGFIPRQSSLSSSSEYTPTPLPPLNPLIAATVAP